MGKIFRKIIALSLVFSTVILTACSSGNSARLEQTGDEEKYPKMKIRLTTNGTSVANDTKTAEMISKLVAQGSGNNIQISVFSDDQLAGGNMIKGIEMVSQGAVEMAAYATSTLSAVDEKLMVACIPWLFNDYQEVSRVIDSTGAPYYSKILSENNLQYLASTHNGFRQITNSQKTVRKPEDIRGMKIRTPGGEIYRRFWEAFKADPIAMSWSEVYTALQQGTIDGQENGYSVTNSANVYEVQKYMTEWNYTYEQYLFMANDKFWDSLTPETKKLIEESTKTACAWGREQVEKEADTLRKKFRNSGVEVYQPTKEEMDAFKKVVAPMKAKYAEKFGVEADKAFNLTGKYEKR